MWGDSLVAGGCGYKGAYPDLSYPYRPKDPNHSAVGVRMGTLGGSHRQKSFFDQDDYQPGAANRVSVATY